MAADAYRVKVAKDLEDLIPTYLDNRKKELGALRAALAGADFEQLRQLGHRMRGVGNSYGFERISVIGEEIEAGARSQDKRALETQIAAYGEYLSRLQVSYE
jgi:HPt (histidine-containing phosphotransfer) domain-containing protein